MPVDADVIIAGAGPAGTLAAYDLASRGMDVLILEKSLFPRYKVCGAGITHKTLTDFPFDITPVMEQTIRSIRFSHCFSAPFTRTSDFPLIHCTMREKLDPFLLLKAVNAGARIRHQEHIKGVWQDDKGVTVETRQGKRFRSRFLIGADGASSIVSALCGFRKNLSNGMAWEAEMDAEKQEISRYGQTVFLDWGTLPGGYGWIFPKGDHFSVGVGGPARYAHSLIPYFNRFVTGTGIRFTHTLSMKSWPIPVRVERHATFHVGRILVAGDAAGLTDPLTGEGIHFAIRSGRIAAHTLLSQIHHPAPSLSGYSSEIRRSLMPEIREAYRLLYLFSVIPETVHRLVSDNDRVWRAFCKILRGERTYFDVRNGFGKYRFLWGTATSVAGFLYRLKRPDK